MVNFLCNQLIDSRKQARRERGEKEGGGGEEGKEQEKEGRKKSEQVSSRGNMCWRQVWVSSA